MLGNLDFLPHEEAMMTLNNRRQNRKIFRPERRKTLHDKDTLKDLEKDADGKWEIVAKVILGKKIKVLFLV